MRKPERLDEGVIIAPALVESQFSREDVISSIKKVQKLHPGKATEIGDLELAIYGNNKQGLKLIGN